MFRRLPKFKEMSLQFDTMPRFEPMAVWFCNLTQCQELNPWSYCFCFFPGLCCQWGGNWADSSGWLSLQPEEVPPDSHHPTQRFASVTMVSGSSKNDAKTTHSKYAKPVIILINLLDLNFFVSDFFLYVFLSVLYWKGNLERMQRKFVNICVFVINMHKER